MSDYTPTTDDVWARWEMQFCVCVNHVSGCEARAYLDRWLAAHDAEVRAQALTEAADAAHALGTLSGSRIEVGARAADWLRARATHPTAERAEP